MVNIVDLWPIPSKQGWPSKLIIELLWLEKLSIAVRPVLTPDPSCNDKPGGCRTWAWHLREDADSLVAKELKELWTSCARPLQTPKPLVSHWFHIWLRKVQVQSSFQTLSILPAAGQSCQVNPPYSKGLPCPWPRWIQVEVQSPRNRRQHRTCDAFRGLLPIWDKGRLQCRGEDLGRPQIWHEAGKMWGVA